MNLHFKLLFALLAPFLLVACVKNEPLVNSYQVPATFVPTTTDSSAMTRVIMMQGVRNYLVTSANVQLQNAVLDSLWENDDSTFTVAMVPNFVYTNDILNRMRYNLKEITADADSLKRFADSVVVLSQKNSQAGGNGIAGVQTQSSPYVAKRLFDETGRAFTEIWYNAMLGAMSMNNAFLNFRTTAQTGNSSWDLAYQYMGFPHVYDPAFDYNATPVKPDRPLAIAALFAESGNAAYGAKIYEEYRRAKASANGGNPAVAQSSIDSIAIYTEKLLASTVVAGLDSLKQSSDQAAKLHYLSRTYGLIRALKFRGTFLLSEVDYWQIRKWLDANFYTLIQEPGYATIEQIRSKLVDAYSL